MSRRLWFVPLLLATSVLQADETPEAKPATEGAKLIDGMSVLGNQEAPKSLVIVPWKSSALGDSLGVSTLLDDSRQPIDREVFLRALRYYEIRTEGGRERPSSVVVVDQQKR